MIPGLSDNINFNLLQSEKAGGLYIGKVQPGQTVRVQTSNTTYTFQRLMDDHGWMVEGHPTYCPKPTRCNIHGSTWGGSMIKVEFIGIGMYMEIGLILPNGDLKVITTSPVERIEVH